MDGMNQAIGGLAAIDAAVDRFHERVSADPELAGFFEGMDMRRILARQLAVLALVAAGATHSALAVKKRPALHGAR